MATFASPPVWNIEQLRFPKALDDDPRGPALHERLRASCAKLWDGGIVQVPVVPWSDTLANALDTARGARHLLQGMDRAERALAREAHGLSLVDARSATERGSRVSRLLLTSNDGTERFYRQVERLLRTQGTRVLALRVEVDGKRLSAIMGDPHGMARALLVEHKTSVASVLLSLFELDAPADPSP
jgi:hypothetical protein